MTTGLVEWLRSQLDAEEKIARAADEGPWIVGTLSTNVNYDGREGVIGEITVVDGEVWPKPLTVRGSHVCSKPAEGNGRMIADLSRGYRPSRHEANAAHIAANDPAHVLRTVAAHRAILELADRCAEMSHSVAELIMLELAAIYEDRPGFDPSWRADP